MRITSTGNVGIGTSSPSIKLQVETSVNGSDGIWVRNTNTGSSAFGSINCVSGVGAINLRAYSAAHAAWPSTSMIHSASAFTGGMVLFQDGANPIQFWTNGLERFRVTSAGNVGIGTTAPGGKLHVVGTSPSIFVDTSNTFALSVGAASATPNIVAIGTSGTGVPQIQGYTNGFAATTNLAIQPNGGNLGIGTTSPGARLDVVGVFDALPARILRQATYGEILRIGRNGVSETASINYPADGVFAINTAGSERMRINASGNVGIGTTSPSFKFNVVTDAIAGRQNLAAIDRAASNFVTFTNPQYSVDASMGLMLRVFPQSDSRQGAGIIASGGALNGETDLSLFVSSGNASSVSYGALNIKGASGNVGIGTTNPLLNLQINSTAGNNSTLAYSVNNVLTWYNRHNASTGSFEIVDVVNATPRLVIQTNGNIGMGTTSPTSRLEVFDGDASVTTSGSFSFFNSNRNFFFMLFSISFLSSPS